MSLCRLFHTVKHLKPVQIYGRLWSHLARPKPEESGSPGPRQATGAWVAPLAPAPSLLGPDLFVLLNEQHSVASPGDWDDPAWPKLWRYHLHYFDDLVASGADTRREWHTDLLARWMAENPPCLGTGWEPYPLSRRIVNWVKYALVRGALTSPLQQNLAVQARALLQQVEWHIQGNHLLANAKGLVFAGLYFAGAEADAWLKRGLDILDQEIPKQILADGGHFERSPMYHSLVLEDLLDLINVMRHYGQQVPAVWKEKIQAMRIWLQAMVHPDGEIALLNDAAFAVAGTAACLEAYAQRLGLDALTVTDQPVTELTQSGYVRLERDDAVAILDVAPLGPDYLPAHGHADTLAFELSLAGQRVVVDSGTSLYAPGTERARQRSTRAHNTVVVDDLNSSDVWSSFRVGRRARVLDWHVEHTSDLTRVQASHNGYLQQAPRVKHTRVWTLRGHELVIEDHLEGSENHTIEAGLHLHPDIQVCQKAVGSLSLQDPRTSITAQVIPDPAAQSQIHETTYHPEFGLSQPTHCIRMTYTGALPRRFQTVIRW